MAFTIDPQAKYAASHEWVRLEDGGAVIGISDYAQDTLSDVVYADLPQEGDTLTKGQALGTLESVKAAEDVYAPISGTVTAVNTELIDHPEWINQDPYGRAWLVKVTPSNPEEMNELMDATAYEVFLAKEK